MSSPLVSVIIPCFDAEAWVAEAIQSALDQTYPNIEVLVVDDGSTDGSLGVIQRFGDQIRWETGPNRGGNQARNRGFALSRGEYVQFLDADDFLLPEKIERQVACLEREGGDVAFCDWRHQYHESAATVRLGPVRVAGPLDDVLEAILQRRWIPTAALLLRRRGLEHVGGWDESLRGAQDIDLTLSLAFAGLRFVYLPGCLAIYRRYGNVTVSSANRMRWVECNVRVAAKLEAKFTDANRLDSRYRRALAGYYFTVAREFDRESRPLYRKFLARTLEVDPTFRFGGSRAYRCIQSLFGFRAAESLASISRSVLKHWRTRKGRG